MKRGVGMIPVRKIYDGQTRCVHRSLFRVAQGTGGLAVVGRVLLCQTPMLFKLLRWRTEYNPAIAPFLYSICSIWTAFTGLRVCEDCKTRGGRRGRHRQQPAPECAGRS
jgi:hypothetical protein